MMKKGADKTVQKIRHTYLQDEKVSPPGQPETSYSVKQGVNQD